MLMPHRSFSAARALVRRVARESLSWPLATAAKAFCFTSLASLNSKVSLASLASRAATFSSTRASLALAASSVTFASAKALRLGSTVTTML